jgi:hypothetical protein
MTTKDVGIQFANNYVCVYNAEHLHEELGFADFGNKRLWQFREMKLWHTFAKTALLLCS